MNPKHISNKLIREQVILAIKELIRIKKEPNSLFSKTGRAFENEHDFKKFFEVFYEKIKNEIENDFNSFLNLCVLEDKYGLASSYLGGGTLSKEGNTTIEIK